MVTKKGFSNDKHVFWEALVVAVFIFGIGILFGLFLENARADKISELYLTSEINLLDVQIQSELLNLKDLNCEEAIRKNIEFADKVYQDAKILDEYEGASKLKENLVQQHKRYDLLRTLLWLNSIKIKEKCGESFHTIVYLYDYQSEEIEQVNMQEVISRFLGDLKKEYGNSIILIPIAKNMGSSSLELLTKNYEISQTSVIVDEELIIDDLNKLKDIKPFLGKSQGIIRLN